MKLLIILLIILAIAGFGHSGWRRGWYARPVYYEPRPAWGGGGLGIILLLIVVWLLFFHHPRHMGYYYYR